MPIYWGLFSLSFVYFFFIHHYMQCKMKIIVLFVSVLFFLFNWNPRVDDCFFFIFGLTFICSDIDTSFMMRSFIEQNVSKKKRNVINWILFDNKICAMNWKYKDQNQMNFRIKIEMSTSSRVNIIEISRYTSICSEMLNYMILLCLTDL